MSLNKDFPIPELQLSQLPNPSQIIRKIFKTVNCSIKEDMHVEKTGGSGE
jgi:hypothetical protein